MHRVILGLEKGDKLEGDHKDGNGLNNQRRNLRVATRTENHHNRTKYKTNTSGFKGVSAKSNRWMAKINIGGKAKHLGYFDTPELAAAAYAKAAKKHHKEFART